jgi:soluble lytic murein transglycosylase-like protein
MRTSKHSYVYRGDRQRRREKIRKWVLLCGLCLAVYALTQQHQRVATAAPGTLFGANDAHRLRTSLDSAAGELNLVRAQLDRANRIFEFSTRYKVAADLAASVYDIALAEGIEPDLAFRLVRVESEFNPRATSPVGAVGLTQLMPATAKFFDPKITRERLYDREVNLRIGFRYLRTLIRENKGNVRTALLVYNRGPVAVNAARANGVDPANGYETVVMKGYRGRGTVE